jgi:hypothetical protein
MRHYNFTAEASRSENEHNAFRILGNTAKGETIAASIQSFKMGRVPKDLGNFVQELETSVNIGANKIALKKRGQLFSSHMK